MTPVRECRYIRPDSWPQSYPAPAQPGTCPHHMHWNESKGVYRCMFYCGYTEQSPPEKFIENVGVGA